MKSTILAFPCWPSLAGKMKNLSRKSTGKPRRIGIAKSLMEKSGTA